MEKNLRNLTIRKFISEKNIRYEIVPIENGRFNLVSEEVSPAGVLFCGNESELDAYLKREFKKITYVPG